MATEFPAGTDERCACDGRPHRHMSAYTMFNQGELWLPKDRPAVHIDDMGLEWRFNSARLLERGATTSVVRYGWSELFSLSGLSEDNAMDLANDMDHWQAQRERDPLAWVRTTKLYRALIADLPAELDALTALAERARHWSTCAVRTGDITCSCDAGPRADDEAIAAMAAVVQEIRDKAAKAEAERIERERLAEEAQRMREWMAANPGLDPDTGRPWHVDEDGVDHSEPHAFNDHCRFDSCGNCGGYHCGSYCADLYRDTDGGDDL